uniref:Uncharacterized protein n=1 Tax=Arundo donax TaxID=35708 RepID=A0A0A8YHK1_ARUDO
MFLLFLMFLIWPCSLSQLASSLIMVVVSSLSLTLVVFMIAARVS